MNKFTAGIGSLALVAGSAFFVVTAQGQAASAANPQVTTSLSASAVLGSWVHNGSYTDWQEDPTQPTLEDGLKLGERETRTITGSTETTDWVTESPGDGWVQVAERTVIVKPAWTETIPGEPSQWWNFQPNKTEGPFDGPPTFPKDPRGTWTHKGQLPPGHEGADGVYQQGQGNGSWFFRQAGTPDQKIEHAAVTRQELKFERTSPDVTEYRWQILEWVDDNGGENGGENGTTPTDPAQPDDDQGVGAATETRPDQPRREKNRAPGATNPRVPTVIDAGL
ncbi:hypothetical protein [Nocardioides sp.]|uniref:hypothetical protein n=1 Tax=Nocardioides sp. TaxID=35761 RepID=UPI002ED3FE71